MSGGIELDEAEGGESRPPSNRALRLADGFFAVVAGAVLFGMMVMTTIDVFGRYILNAPLGFAFEMTQLAMAVVVFAALPSVTLRGQHVTVGLFENAFGGWALRIRNVLIALAAAAGCFYLAWRLSTLAARFLRYGEITTVLHVPVGYVAWIGVAGLVAAGIAALLIAASAIRGRDLTQ
jgi:TRAP-type transport system small permease protein